MTKWTVTVKLANEGPTTSWTDLSMKRAYDKVQRIIRCENPEIDRTKVLYVSMWADLGDPSLADSVAYEEQAQ